MALPTTEIVAWWGAILSTIVFAWDIVKWRLSGPRLRFTVSGNMKTINIPEYEGKTLISAEVINYGDQPTTVTNMGFVYYGSRWNLFRNRPTTAFFIANPSLSQRIPFELKQGNPPWIGFAEQTDDVGKMAREGYLICHVYHTHSRRPLRRRVVINHHLSR